jgi:DNA adenine methylase
MRKVSAKLDRKKALLSPFRYPGGKTWLRPVIRQWLRQKVTILAEAFAGGGVISITALNEGLAKKAIMIERDRNVASVWSAMAVIRNKLSLSLKVKILTFANLTKP